MREHSENLKEIAERLRGLREIEGVGAEALAAEFGVPTEDYLRYEGGEADIPVSLLYAAANKFGVELTEILTGGAPRLKAYCHVPKDKGLRVTRRKEYGYQNLAYNFARKKAEPFLVTVEPKPEDAGFAENRHPGQEFNYVLEGRLELRFHKERLILETGDSLYFDSSEPHGMRALDGKPAKFLALIMQ
jgi:quercetin dioxygenase-like cupin family protein